MMISIPLVFFVCKGSCSHSLGHMVLICLFIVNLALVLDPSHTVGSRIVSPLICVNASKGIRQSKLSVVKRCILQADQSG